MIDPLRPQALEAVAECQQAGVLVTMVTGDHRVTALAIARDLGLAINEEQVVTAAELEINRMLNSVPWSNVFAFLPASLRAKSSRSSKQQRKQDTTSRLPVME